MAVIDRVRVEWNGSSVIGGGVSTFYFDDSHTGYLADLRVFFNDWRFAIPSTVEWTFPNSGDILDVATGAITGTWTEPAVSSLVAAGAGNHVSGVGMRQVWRTNGIREGRRVRGHTFFCPLTQSMYGTDGIVVPAQVTAADAAAATLIASSGGFMRIYSRPSPGHPGVASEVVSGEAPRAISWLRSRRT